MNHKSQHIVNLLQEAQDMLSAEIGCPRLSTNLYHQPDLAAKTRVFGAIKLDDAKQICKILIKTPRLKAVLTEAGLDK